MMKAAEARALAVRLAAGAIGGDAADWRRGSQELERLDGRSWLLLDQAARSFDYTTGTPVSGVKGWLGPSAVEPTGLVAAVTSLHVDGRIRQRATRLLASVNGPVPTSALAVRLLDHVPQVRDEALAATRDRLDVGTAEVVLDVVLAGRGRVAAAHALAELREYLLAGDRGPVALRELMASDRRSVRRWTFSTARRRGLLEDSELIEAALSDTDQWVQATCADWLMQSEPPGLVPLLGATSVEARMIALTRVPDESLDDATLEQLLVDRAPRVREQARWRARRRRLDVVEVYRRLVVVGRSPRVRAASLDGIATLGDDSDVPGIVALLQDPSPRVRAAVVGAVVARAEPGVSAELLVRALDDPSPRVTAAAARGLARLGVHPGRVEHLWGSAQPAARRAAWRVARASGDWNRVEADLRAASDEDPELAGLGVARHPKLARRRCGHDLGEADGPSAGAHRDPPAYGASR